MHVYTAEALADHNRAAMVAMQCGRPISRTVVFDGEPFAARVPNS